MTPKTTSGKTTKYDGVKNAVKANKTPEEPKLQPEQILDIFKAFGFEPNKTNNDVVFWSTRPISEAPKLIEKLHKQRDEMNKEIQDKEKTKKTLGKLSDNEIADLYDEYGLPAPDPEWARNNLPNDPIKVRTILETQRKAADDVLKKHSKNMVNAMPEIPKASAAPQGQPAPMQMPMPMAQGGIGGPGDPSGFMGDPSTVGPATPFFIGDHSIVKIVNPNNPNMSTVWLVDAKKKVLRPFVSKQAFENAFEDPEEARNAIVSISSKELGEGGALDGFKLLSNKDGIQDDGSMPKIDVTEAQVQKRYGKQPDPIEEKKALSILDGLMGKWTQSSAEDPNGLPQEPSSSVIGRLGPQGEMMNPNIPPMPQDVPEVADTEGYGGKGGTAIPEGSYRQATHDPEAEQTATTLVRSYIKNSGVLDPTFASTILNNPLQIAMFVEAIVHGGYQYGDVLTELLRKQKVYQGDKTFDTYDVIDPDIVKTEYLKTTEGNNALIQTQTQFPESFFFGKVDLNLLKYGREMPQDMFKEIIPLLDIKSQEFKDAVSKIEANYSDLTMAIAEAENDHERASALDDYNIWKKELDRTFGITLSDNANTAWQQIQTLGENYSKQGIKSSGLENEAVDDYLRALREKNKNLRDTHLSTERQKKKEYLQAKGTAEEIAALTEQEKIDFGFKPDAETLAALNIDTLMAKFPNKTREELMDYINTVIDPSSGLLRSTLYGNFYKDIVTQKQAKNQYQIDTVLNDFMTDEKSAYEAIEGSLDGDFSDLTSGQQKVVDDLAKDDITTKPDSPTTATADEKAKLQAQVDQLKIQIDNWKKANPGKELPASFTTAYNSLINNINGITTPPASSTGNPAPAAPVTSAKPAPVASTNLGPYAQSMTQAEIVALQNGLIAAGYKIPAIQSGTAQPGYYGDETKAAVAAWQKANGVTTTASTAGYWGPLSKQKLATLGGFKPTTSSTATTVSSAISSPPKTTATTTTPVYTAPKITTPTTTPTVTQPKVTTPTPYVAPKITTPTTTPTPTPTTSTTYKVVSGDTLSQIAARNNTTVANLQTLNGIKDANMIYAGSTLKLK